VEELVERDERCRSVENEIVDALERRDVVSPGGANRNLEADLDSKP
jgi:hypothetical protein